MGMAASQGRLLTLTARKNTIGYQLQELSMEKMSLTREMQKVSKDYNNSLSAKKFKWSNNAGVDYVDLSYSAIMRPSAVNQNKPYLITNSSGKVVIDRQYREFAEKISPNGFPGGDYESQRTDILASLLGVSATVISESQAQDEYLNTLKEDVYNKKSAYQEWKSKESSKSGRNNVGYKSVSDFRKLLGLNENVSYSNILDKFNNAKRNASSGSNWRSEVTNIVNQIKSGLSKYFVDDTNQSLNGGKTEKTTFETSCDNLINAIPQDSENKEALPGYINKENSTINTEELLAIILGGSNLTRNDNGNYLTRDTENAQWQDWYNQLNTKYNDWKNAEKVYKDANDNTASAFGGDQKTKIEFYDALFTVIAEQGWTYDSQVTDNDYLNNMFQNNQFYITEVTNNEDYGEEYAEYKNRKYDYSTDLASNFEKLFLVNDEDIRQEALTNYEYKKSIIKVKEERIDTRMKDLETEQSAITNMIKGIETVRKDNTETYFSIFS